LWPIPFQTPEDFIPKIPECDGAFSAERRCNCQSDIELCLTPHSRRLKAVVQEKGSVRLIRYFVLFVANPIPNPGRFHPEDSEHFVVPQFIRARFC